MASSHDELSTTIHEEIVRKIAKQEKGWKQIFSPAVSRVGSWDWPRPDYVISDDNNNWLIASEFKPPGWNKREYITGLGQCISYLEKHNYSMLVIPQEANDGFPIGNYIKNILHLSILKGFPTCLVVYDHKNVARDTTKSISLHVQISHKRKDKPPSEASTNRTYWAFWRDTSNYEVFELLRLSDNYSSLPGDIYTQRIFPEFWSKKCNGEMKNWEGEPRKIKSTTKMKQSEKQNNKIPLFHLGLWDQATGKLTFSGVALLGIGKRYGPDSKQFIDCIAKLVLTEGKHLDIINHIQKFQYDDPIMGKITKSTDFYKGVDAFLENRNLIGKRKPGRKTTGAKQSFIRDEPKLWNKLGLLHHRGKDNYFFPGKGFKFNWKRITDILSQDFSNL